MSKLFDLAKLALRRILQKRSTLSNGPPGGMKSTPGKPPIVTVRPSLPPGGKPSSSGAPPIVPRSNPAQRPEAAPHAQQPRETPPPAQSAQEVKDIQEVEDVYTEIQLFGRDRGHSDEMQSVMDGMRLVKSSNVYGYYFELEPGAKNSPSISSVKYGKQAAAHSGSVTGILYVTFLGQGPNGSRSNSAGATYAYYNVPVKKYGEFTHLADSSAGGAVWDYLRVRGTIAEHQHQYRLVQVSGEHIPRKATAKGFKIRQLSPVGQPTIPNSTWSAISRLEHSPNQQVRAYAGQMKRALLREQNFRRSTLAPRTFLPNRAAPNRGRPNRGAP